MQKKIEHCGVGYTIFMDGETQHRKNAYFPQVYL